MELHPLDETQPTGPAKGQPSVEPNQPVPEESGPTDGPAPVLPTMEAQEPAQFDPAVPPPSKRKLHLSWIAWSLLGILLLGLIAAGSSYGGYLSAVRERVSFQQTQEFDEAQAQYNLGLQDMQDKHYDLARQRFEYVINLDPGFPGVADRLAEVLLALNSTATPTPVPTPTVTPTPDLRGREELFTQAQAHLLASDWTAAIEALLTLRKRDPAYLAVDVDGMLSVALRNRGVDKIARQADLEGGTYDLALAERFGPLDVEARNWREWAELYIRGASFWGVDWAQAVYYFSQIAPIAPNLVDGSGYTATERYRLALIGYADWMAKQSRWCEARDQFQLALDMKADPAVQPTAEYVVMQCENPQPTSEIQGEPGGPTVTPTATLFGSVESTPTPTELTPIETPATPYP